MIGVFKKIIERKKKKRKKKKRKKKSKKNLENSKEYIAKIQDIFFWDNFYWYKYIASLFSHYISSDFALNEVIF